MEFDRWICRLLMAFIVAYGSVLAYGVVTLTRIDLTPFITNPPLAKWEIAGLVLIVWALLYPLWWAGCLTRKIRREYKA